MPAPPLPKLDTEKLKLALSEKVEESKARLTKRHPEAVRFFKKVGVEPGKIREHAVRIASAGTLAAALLLGGPGKEALSMPKHVSTSAPSQTLESKTMTELGKILPETVAPLNTSQETEVSRAIDKIWGLKAYASLNNEKLNQSYGYIGAEQHLPRFPGDSIGEHDQFQNEGITPGLGAWGYFANSRDNLTQDLVAKEKYYVAVQTLYLPDWGTRTKYLSEWYKYRKVLVVNPVNGKTIVADVADAGPADWTGKHFGGSPEVMAYLGLNVGPQKGPVILFFVDDKNNEVPLGPVEYNVVSGPPRIAQK